MLLSPQQPPSRGEPWCLQWWAQEGGGRLALLRWHLWECHSQVAPSSSREKCYCNQKAWPCLMAAGPSTSRAWGEPHEVVSKAAGIPKMCPHSTHHPKHRHLLCSNPAPDVNPMRNNCLGHPGHFPLLPGGGWIRSQVLPRNSQRSHWDWPVWLQQALVLPVLVSPWPGHTLRRVFHMLLHPHS